MTAVFARRRRAEEFAALVDSRSAGDSSDTRYDDLLRLVGTLRETSPAPARPEFVADLRSRLMTAADTALVPTAGLRPPADAERLALPTRRPTRERRIAAAVGGLALVGATTSMAMAAQDALPGDALYPIKRAIENAQTGLQLAEGDKGVTLLANASGRLDEVSALSEDARAGDNGDEDTLAIADTLDVFSEQASEASDLLIADYAENGAQASISELRDFTADSLEQLVALEPQVPDAARDELVRAAQLLVEIDAAAQQACPVCAGSGITEIPRIFAPVSARFTVPEASGATQTARHEQRGDGKRHGDGADRGADRESKQRAGDGAEDAPAVPAVAPEKLPSGSVLQPAPAAAPNDGQQSTSNDDPIGTVTDGLTKGGSTKTSTPPQPDLGDVDDAVGEVTDDVAEGVKGVTEDLNGLADDVGDATEPVTGKLLP